MCLNQLIYQEKLTAIELIHHIGLILEAFPLLMGSPLGTSRNSQERLKNSQLLNLTVAAPKQ